MPWSLTSSGTANVSICSESTVVGALRSLLPRSAIRSPSEKPRPSTETSMPRNTVIEVGITTFETSLPSSITPLSLSSQPVEPTGPRSRDNPQSNEKNLFILYRVLRFVFGFRCVGPGRAGGAAGVRSRPGRGPVRPVAVPKRAESRRFIGLYAFIRLREVSPCSMS